MGRLKLIITILLIVGSISFAGSSVSGGGSTDCDEWYTDTLCNSRFCVEIRMPKNAFGLIIHPNTINRPFEFVIMLQDLEKGQERAALKQIYIADIYPGFANMFLLNPGKEDSIIYKQELPEGGSLKKWTRDGYVTYDLRKSSLRLQTEHCTASDTTMLLEILKSCRIIDNITVDSVSREHKFVRVKYDDDTIKENENDSVGVCTGLTSMSTLVNGGRLMDYDGWYYTDTLCNSRLCVEIKMPVNGRAVIDDERYGQRPMEFAIAFDRIGRIISIADMQEQQPGYSVRPRLYDEDRVIYKQELPKGGTLTKWTRYGLVSYELCNSRLCLVARDFIASDSTMLLEIVNSCRVLDNITVDSVSREHKQFRVR